MAQRSLKRGLALWLVAVLSAVLLADAWHSYEDARAVTNQAYDRSLAAALKGIAERIYANSDEIIVDIPYAALELIETRSADRVFYAVSEYQGKHITGYENLPLPKLDAVSREIHFYEAEYKGQVLRLGAVLKPLYRTEFPKPVLVVFGETTYSRQELVHHIFIREVARKALLIVVALAVALLATRRAVKPIEKLGRAIGARPEDDLRPVDTADIPAEVLPLVGAINVHMDRIARMLEARRRFITDAAHQLRTPLAVLNTQAQYALRQQDAKEMRAAVEALQNSLRSAIHLTNQMLALSRAEPINGLAQQRQPVNLRLLAQETVIELLPLAASRNLDLGMPEDQGQASDATCCTVLGHALMLREMLANLLDNALRYTPGGGMVTVAVCSGQSQDTGDKACSSGLAPGWVRLSVLDSGPGIAPQFREAVFQRFHRLEGQGGDGSGLGLAIVKEIVQAHGGHIRLGYGPQGQGLLVEVELPQATDPRSRGSD